jgi:tRNA G18 (ribose-2'-O)-methylase SpoU
MLRRSTFPSSYCCVIPTNKIISQIRFRSNANQGVNNNFSPKKHKWWTNKVIKAETAAAAASSSSQQQQQTVDLRQISTITELGQQKLVAALTKYSSKAAAMSEQQNKSFEVNNNNNQDPNMTTNNNNNNSSLIIEMSFDETTEKSLIENIRHDQSIFEASGIPAATVFWNDTRLLRQNRYSRMSSGLAVVGGSESIKRIMESKNTARSSTPRCLFVPDDLEELPDWITKHNNNNNNNQNNNLRPLPLIVIRAPRARINHDLLSAEKSDGFAAQFHLPVRLPREFAFVSSEQFDENQQQTATKPLRRPASTKLNRLAVCHGLRIPGNVGAIIKSAYRNGYDGIVLDRCCELTGEKVLRAAAEAAFDPNFHIFEFGHKIVSTPLKPRSDRENNNNNSQVDGADDENIFHQAEKDFAEGASSGLLLKRIAAAHNLLPLMMIPAASTPFSTHEDIGVVEVTAAAKQFHYINYKSDQNEKSDSEKQQKQQQVGTMLVVGGEANGLNGLASEWNRDALFVPLVPLCLQMDNPLINSINVASAAATAMYYFRPGAKKEFEELFRRGIVPKNVDDDQEDDQDVQVAKLMNPTYLLPTLNEAREQSERLLK